MKKILPGILVLLLSMHCFASSEDNNMSKESGIAESYVMLYYTDLAAPRNFYQQVLGLEASYDDEWVTLYRTSPSSYVGVVREGGTAWHKAQETSAVMLSLVVDNVDKWYDRISSITGVVILKEIYNHDSAPIRAFLLEDPGGYTVEIFQWLK